MGCSATSPFCIGGIVGAWVIYPHYRAIFCSGDCGRKKGEGKMKKS